MRYVKRFMEIAKPLRCTVYADVHNCLDKSSGSGTERRNRRMHVEALKPTQCRPLAAVRYKCATTSNKRLAQNGHIVVHMTSHVERPYTGDAQRLRGAGEIVGPLLQYYARLLMENKWRLEVDIDIRR